MWIWPTLLLVVGHLLSLTIVRSEPGSVSTISNPSGPDCGEQRCITSSTCLGDGNCQCPDGTNGDGAFHCYDSNSIHSQIMGTNNTLTTFNGATAKMYWPCRFRFTEFRTFRTSRRKECHFQIFGVNSIVMGKTVLTGMEVHFRSSNDNNQDVKNGIGIRKEGTANNGVYTYKECGRDMFEPELAVTSTGDQTEGSGSGDGSMADMDAEDDSNEWGEPVSLDIGRGNVVACQIDNDNFASVVVPDCGVDIRFRAPDKSTDELTPGLSVSISQDNGPIRFSDVRTYSAESPNNLRLEVDSVSLGITKEQVLLSRSMEYAAEQYSTPAGDECQDTASTYREYCNNDRRRVAALEACSFFLDDPDIVACMDPSGGVTTASNSLNAFKLCVWNSCSRSKSVCDLLKLKVQEANCLHLTPFSFMSMSCPN